MLSFEYTDVDYCSVYDGVCTSSALMQTVVGMTTAYILKACKYTKSFAITRTHENKAMCRTRIDCHAQYKSLGMVEGSEVNAMVS